MRTPSALRVAGIAGLGGAAATAALVLSAASARAGGADDAAATDTKTTVTIWRAPSPTATYQYGQYGGYSYGQAAPSGPGDAAFVTHRRSVDVTNDGELRFPGVSTRIDPSTVQFRSITDPKGTSVVEQKFAYDLGSPEHLMKRYVGKQVTITTSRGEVTGILRGLDSDALMLETGTGKDRAVEIIKRGENLLDVKLSGDDSLATVPTLIWKVQSKKAGKQDVEVSYRTDGLRWDADYTAILDEDKSSVDLSAWATVSNDTGIELKDANLELVTGILDNQAPVAAYAGAYVPRAASAAPDTFTVPRPVTIAPGGTVQVELIPARSNVASRRVVVYETTPDMSASYQSYMYTDCYSYSQQPSTGAHGELDLEVDAPAKNTVLPEGGVRVFKRKGDGLELLGEDTLHVNAETGHARLRLGNDDSVTGTRRQLECKYDDHARTLREKFEIEVENKSKEPTEVVLKEYMYRWVNWKMDGEDIPGSKAAAQTQEYRVKLGANSKKTFSYAVLYSW